jgi:hypothetical protein
MTIATMTDEATVSPRRWAAPAGALQGSPGFRDFCEVVLAVLRKQFSVRSRLCKKEEVG